MKRGHKKREQIKKKVKRMKKLRWNFWTETKGSRQKKQDIFKEKVDNKENSDMFFEVLSWKTNLQEKLITKRRKIKSFFQRKRRIKDIFCTFAKKKNDNFWRDPKKKIDKRKSRKVISRSATNQKKTWNTQGNSTTQGGKKTRYLPQMKAGFQKDRHKFMKMNKYSGNKSDAEMKKIW